MKRDVLTKFLTACTGVFPDGVITVKDKTAIVSHTDTGGIAMGYIVLTDFSAPDGQYGVDFGKAKSFATAVKDTDGEVIFEGSNIKMKFGKTSKSMSQMKISTLRPIRPRIVDTMKFSCKIDIDKNEFIDFIDVLNKTGNVQNNSVVRTGFVFDGVNLQIKSDDQIDCTEHTFDVISVEYGKGVTAEAYYPFDYLIEFAGVFKKLNTDNLTVSLGTNMPLVVYIKDENLEAEYLLAQMIDGD